MDHVRDAVECGARMPSIAQVTGVDLGALADPVRRVALVADAYLEVRVAEQLTHDRLPDHAGAAGDENATHCRRAPSASSAV